jgi:biopolymer transport protein TolR
MSAASESHDEAPRPHKGVKADINVTPLVDVVLVLLIIFMVVTPQMEAGAAVDLPAARNPDTEAPGSLEPTTLSITKDGKLYFDKEQLEAPQMEERLKALHREKPELRLVLKADKAVEYEQVRSLFKTCQQIGFPGVALQVIDRANQQGK